MSTLSSGVHQIPAIVVRNAGFASTVQDMGRRGYQHMGISPSGVMDWRACALGNTLVGNACSAAAIEYALGGIAIEFNDDRLVVLAGAYPKAQLDGETIRPYQVFEVHCGQVMRIAGIVSGAYGYVCVSGGIDVPVVLGSRATNVLASLGGKEGRRLRDGDELPLGEPPVLPHADTRRQLHAEDLYYHFKSSLVPIQVIPSADQGKLDPEDLPTLLTSSYEVSPRSDRMGLRLTGGQLHPRDVTGILSEGIALGTIQVPPQGQPIVVMADHQTTGGYAKVATVTTACLPRLAQCGPGRRVSFEEVTPVQARRSLLADVRYVRELGIMLDGSDPWSR